MEKIILTALGVLLVNIPFGYCRKASRKLSFAWFLAIHVPVALSILARFLLDINFNWYIIPLFAGMFFAGQYLGARMFIYRSTKDE